MRGLWIVIVVAACSSSSLKQLPAPVGPDTAAMSARNPKAVKKSEVHVDRRVELISIVERLAGADEYRQGAETPYLADVDKTFAAFASHPAVTMTRELSDKFDIGFDAPMTLAAYLDDHYAPIGNIAVDLPAASPRWKPVDIEKYVAQLAAFAAATKFDAFFDAHRPYIASVEDRFRTALDRENPAGWFDDFFGAAGARFVVVPGLLEGPSNYGTHYGTTKYQIIGVENLDATGLPIIDEELIELVIHEMAHSFVNPIFDRHLAELLPSVTSIFALVKEPMSHQAYPTPQTMVDEAGVRAITVLYVRDRKSAAAAATATRGEVRRSFLWTAELADSFARFRKERTRYPTFDAYMPEVVAFFTQLAKQYEHGLPPQPFLGEIDSVFADNPIFVTPASGDPAVIAYANKIHDRFFKTQPMVASSAQVIADHPHVAMVAYGTPATNAVVADVLARSHITITDDAIDLNGKKFTGPGLVLISSAARGDDPMHGITIYTAAHDADIVGINGVRAGGTDWVVGRKLADGEFETVELGNF